MMNHFHFSTAECFDSCPYKFKLRYLDDLETIPSDDPHDPLRLGTAIHRGMELDSETAIKEYLMSYNIITDDQETEVIKLEHWIPKLKELIPEGIHEYNFSDKVYEGTADLLVQVSDNLPPMFDLYDFKYSNNIEHYMESRQLHVYKHYLEKTHNLIIRKMFFVFVPKVMSRQKKDETLEQFRNRLRSELEQEEIKIKEVQYDPSKVDDFKESCMNIGLTSEFKKNESYLCDWCEYKNYCKTGETYMLLPNAERRQVGKTTKRKLWIYGGAFCGKTTFVDKAPSPLNLNTDGNIQFVTMQYVPIKDTFEGRQKVLAWQVFKDAVDELERTAGENGFKTLVADLTEDLYESCRLFMYEKLGITHESDDSFRAWDKVRTEFLSTMRKFVNLDYENIILISHEDTSKDITKKSGDKITAIKPNIPDKVANKLAGMVDIVARVVVDGDERTLEFKSDEVVFGGGRLKNISKNSISLDWEELCKVYDEANASVTVEKAPKTEEKVQHEETPSAEETHVEPASDDSEKPPFDVDEKPVRTRRTRKERT